jgi:hypothetical protein
MKAAFSIGTSVFLLRAEKGRPKDRSCGVVVGTLFDIWVRPCQLNWIVRVLLVGV